MLALAAIAWSLATGALFGLTRDRQRLVPVTFWLTQPVFLVVAFVLTSDAGGVRIAPPIIVATAVAQFVGLAAILLRPAQRLGS